MQMRNVYFKCWLLLCICWSGFAQAQQSFIPPKLADVDRAEFSLLTVGLGTELYARYGHTMIRVQDPGNNLDYLVNWGMFDFSDPMFIPKFFRGILIYRMGFSPYGSSVRYYRDYEKRSVVEDRLHLTVKQKVALLDKIIWNAQPENILFPYQYFRYNCSTIPRDYIDGALGGVLRPQLEAKKVGMTFRQYVRDNLGINPIVGWGLDVIFNSDNDRELSAWEEMFYPLKLREHLTEVSAVDDDGKVIPNQPLLSDRHVLVDLPEPDGKALDGYWFVWMFVVAPLLLVLLAEGRPGFSLQARGFKKQWQWRVVGAVCIFWGLTSGFFGLTHTLAWLFSMHTDLHHNANILLFWPFDWFMLIWGFALLGWGSAGIPRGRWQKFWQVVSKAHIGFCVVYLMVAASGVTGQYLTRVVFHMVPASLLYYYVVGWRVARPTDQVSSV